MTNKFTVLNGNLLEQLRNIPTHSHAAVITDPPYCSGASMTDKKQSSESKYKQGGSSVTYQIEEFSDQMSETSLIYFVALWANQCARIITNGSLFCFIDWRSLHVFRLGLEMAGLRVVDVLVWNKQRGRPRPWGFRSASEFILHASVGKLSKGSSAKYGRSNILNAPSIPSTDRAHISEKPTGLIQQLIAVCPDGPILDPFCGSGATLLAAHSEGQDSTGIDVLTDCCDLTRERMVATGAVEAPLLERFTHSAEAEPEPPPIRSLFELG